MIKSFLENKYAKIIYESNLKQNDKIEKLNEKFGNYFYQLSNEIPSTKETMPNNLMLYNSNSINNSCNNDDSGCCGSSINDSSINCYSFDLSPSYKKYFICCFYDTSDNIIASAKEYLQN